MDTRMPATFASKELCISSALTSVEIGLCPRPVNTSMERHSCRGVERSASMFSFQIASRVFCSRSHYLKRCAVHVVVAAATSARSARRTARSRRRTLRLAIRQALLFNKTVSRPNKPALFKKIKNAIQHALSNLSYSSEDDVIKTNFILSNLQNKTEQNCEF